MKKLHLSFIFTGFFIILCNHLQAQISEYKLSDYKLPDIKRHMLDFDFDFSNYHNFLDNESVNNRYLNMNGGSDISYSFYKNSRRYQGWIYLDEELDCRLTNYETDTVTKSREQYFSSNTIISSNNKFFNHKEQFVFANFFSTIRYDHAKYKIEEYQNNNWLEIDNSKNRNTKYNLSSSVGIGKGRIEPVQDARHALYILDALKKAGRLKREPSKEEINQIATNISILKNERVLDARLKKIDELNSLDSLLNQMDLIESIDMVYFSHLNDMWDYGGNQYRNSGFRFDFRYNPIYEQIKIYHFLVYENKVKYTIFQHKIEFSAEWARPVKQKFQSDLSFNINGFLRNFNNNVDQFQIKGLSGGIIYKFAYFPNTRTSFGMGIQFFGQKVLEKDYQGYAELPGYDNNNSLWISPFFMLDYYISPKLNLRINYQTAASFNKPFEDYSSGRKYFNTILNVGFNYSIF
jgi:hypothetical protein